MSPKIDVITLGVNDMEQAGAFYAGAFGAPVSRDEDGLNVSLSPNASRICLRDWDEVANDAGLPPASRGFRAFTLSYILKSAADVDRILSRAEQYGGQVSKPPRNAVWGYSAYVTDPNGYLWKIASSKRRPLIRREQPITGNGHAVRPEEVPITIGVADMARARRFYEEGLGLPVNKAFGNKFVMFSGEGGGSGLGMYKREALAHDAAVLPEGSGFRGFSLSHVVATAERVDELLARVEGAGAAIVKSAARADRGGYSGCFADPDGNLWQVASQN
jgi:uncharacterized protein